MDGGHRWVDDETNLYNYSNIQVMRHLLLSLWHQSRQLQGEHQYRPYDYILLNQWSLRLKEWFITDLGYLHYNY